MFLRSIVQWTGAQGPIWDETRRLLTRQFAAAADAEMTRKRAEWARRQVDALGLSWEA